MKELISKDDLLTSSKDSPSYQEMVEELNEILVKGAGKPIQYKIKHPNLTGLLLKDLEEKGYEVHHLVWQGILVIS